VILNLMKKKEIEGMLEELKECVKYIDDVLESCCSDDITASSIRLSISHPLQNFIRLVAEGKEKAKFILDSYAELHCGLGRVIGYIPPNADPKTALDKTGLIGIYAMKAQDLATEIVLKVLK